MMPTNRITLQVVNDGDKNVFDTSFSKLCTILRSKYMYWGKWKTLKYGNQSTVSKDSVTAGHCILGLSDPSPRID